MSDRTRFLLSLAVVLVLAGSIVAFELFRSPRVLEQTIVDGESSAQTDPGATTPTPRPSLTPLPTFTPIPTATPIPNGVDDTAAGITYDGWTGTADPGASGGSYHVVSTAGRPLVYKTPISTTSVALLGYRGPDQGQAQVTIDGETQETLDLYAATPEYGVVQEWNALGESSHDIRIRSFDRANPASSGTEVRVDGFRLGEQVIENSDVAVTYYAWVGETNPAAYGGSYRRTKTKDSEVTFTFSGTAFNWISLRCPRCGQAEVIVDEVALETVDLYSETDQWRSIIVFDELSQGEHTVIIRALGTINAASRGAQVVFDGFSVP